MLNRWKFKYWNTGVVREYLPQIGFYAYLHVNKDVFSTLQNFKQFYFTSMQVLL